MIALLIIILILCIFNSVSVVVISASIYRNAEVLNSIGSVLTSMPPVRKKRLQTLVTAPEGQIPGIPEGLVEP